jgi:hypothetical protein
MNRIHRTLAALASALLALATAAPAAFAIGPRLRSGQRATSFPRLSRPGGTRRCLLGTYTSPCTSPAFQSQSTPSSSAACPAGGSP